MKKLKRKYARLCIILGVMALVCCWSSIFIVVHISEFIAKLLIGGGAVLLFCALGVKFALLRCPECGYSGLMPQWSKNDSYHCPKCGIKVHWE